MKKKKDESKIKCDVNNCTHNNNKQNCCELDSVKISCTCDNTECNCCEETICQSFTATSSNITDNEYEGTAELDQA